MNERVIRVEPARLPADGGAESESCRRARNGRDEDLPGTRPGASSTATTSRPLKARQAFGVVGKHLGENLERDLAAQPSVPGAVDRSHATRPKRREDFVGSEANASGESHKKVPES